MPADYTIKQGDTLPVLTDTPTYSDGSAVSLVGGGTVAIAIRSLTSAQPITVTGTVTVTEAYPLAVQYAPSAADTAVAGNFQAEWIINFEGAGQMTFPTVGGMWFSIEPSLSLVAQQLVSLDSLKDYLNISATSRERDAKLMRFIEGVTPLIETVTGPIIPKLYEEWHDGGNATIELLRKPSSGFGTSPVLNVIAASEYRGPIEYPLSLVASPVFGSIYSVFVNKDQGTITRRTAGGRTLAFMPGKETVHIWYQSGQSVTPPNVYEATLELLRVNYENTQQVGAGRRTVSDEQDVGPSLGFFMPHRVRELLAPTRRAPAFA